MTISTTLKASRVASLAKSTLYGRFHDLNLHADGKISPRIYREIAQRISEQPPDLDVVEIGAGAGAGTIAICWGLIDSGGTGKVISVEKCEGGSRTRYGGKDANIERLERHLERFDVSDRVTLYTEAIDSTRADEVLALISTNQIGGLVCDADGRIHRDVQIFWSLLIDGGLFVADDYHPTRTWKHELTYRLVSHFEEVGLVVDGRDLKGTYFGRKAPGVTLDAVDWAYCEHVAESLYPPNQT